MAQPVSFFNVDGIRFDINVLDSFRKKIYDGFDVDNEVEPDMWNEIVRIMNEAVVNGVADSRANIDPDAISPRDADFFSALRHSNEVFSTFKVHTFGQEMASKLFDERGNLRTFKDWINVTMNIASHQVGSWLETEYNTAIIRAHQAADWREFERNKDIFPNLRWMMTTSPEPEETHKHYWMTGLTLPVDDPFWSKHYPGDRWNCKCSLESTDGPVVRPNDIPEEPRIPGLDTNPGKDGCTFSCSHPYFPKDCAHCFAKKAVNGAPSIKNALRRFFYNADESKHCHNCILVQKKISEAYAQIKNKNEEEVFEYFKMRRKEILEETDFLKNVNFQNKDFNHTVIITKKKRKEWLNQSHNHVIEKNEALFDLEELFKKSQYLGPAYVHRKKPEDKQDVLQCHLFLTEIAKEDSWIIVEETIFNVFRIHSCSSSPTIVKTLKNMDS